MKYLTWLLKAVIFLLVFVFALNNQAPVQVHLFLGGQWEAPLVLVLLLVLVLGVALGVSAMLPLWWRARRQRIPENLDVAAAEPARAASLSSVLPPVIPDAVPNPDGSSLKPFSHHGL